jgi:hypothetical protein
MTRILGGKYYPCIKKPLALSEEGQGVRGFIGSTNGGWVTNPAGRCSPIGHLIAESLSRAHNSVIHAPVLGGEIAFIATTFVLSDHLDTCVYTCMF